MDNPEELEFAGNILFSSHGVPDWRCLICTSERGYSYFNIGSVSHTCKYRGSQYRNQGIVIGKITGGFTVLSETVVKSAEDWLLSDAEEFDFLLFIYANKAIMTTSTARDTKTVTILS